MEAFEGGWGEMLEEQGSGEGDDHMGVTYGRNFYLVQLGNLLPFG